MLMFDGKQYKRTKSTQQQQQQQQQPQTHSNNSSNLSQNTSFAQDFYDVGNNSALNHQYLQNTGYCMQSDKFQPIHELHWILIVMY